MFVSIPLGSSSDMIAGMATVIAAIVSGFLARQKIRENKAQTKLEDSRIGMEHDMFDHLQSQRDYATSEAKESKRMQLVSEYENQESKARVITLESELVGLRSRVQLLSQLVTRLTTALDLTRSHLSSIIEKSAATVTSPTASTLEKSP